MSIFNTELPSFKIFIRKIDLIRILGLILLKGSDKIGVLHPAWPYLLVWILTFLRAQLADYSTCEAFLTLLPGVLTFLTATSELGSYILFCCLSCKGILLSLSILFKSI